jgi:hypothetical protein
MEIVKPQGLNKLELLTPLADRVNYLTPERVINHSRSIAVRIADNRTVLRTSGLSE